MPTGGFARERVGYRHQAGTGNLQAPEMGGGEEKGGLHSQALALGEWRPATPQPVLARTGSSMPVLRGPGQAHPLQNLRLVMNSPHPFQGAG